MFSLKLSKKQSTSPKATNLPNSMKLYPRKVTATLKGNQQTLKVMVKTSTSQWGPIYWGPIKNAGILMTLSPEQLIAEVRCNFCKHFCSFYSNCMSIGLCGLLPDKWSNILQCDGESRH